MNLIEIDHLITTDRYKDKKMPTSEELKWLNFTENPNSKLITKALADPNVRNLEKSALVQFERRGVFIVDKINNPATSTRSFDLLNVPNGKTKNEINFRLKGDMRGHLEGFNSKEKKQKHSITSNNLQ